MIYIFTVDAIEDVVVCRCLCSCGLVIYICFISDKTYELAHHRLRSMIYINTNHEVFAWSVNSMGRKRHRNAFVGRFGFYR